MSWLLFDLKKTIREFSGLWQLFVSNEDITSYRRCVLFAYDNRDSQTSTCREGTKVLGPDLSLVCVFFHFCRSKSHHPAAGQQNALQAKEAS